MVPLALLVPFTDPTCSIMYYAYHNVYSVHGQPVAICAVVYTLLFASSIPA